MRIRPGVLHALSDLTCMPPSMLSALTLLTIDVDSFSLISSVIAATLFFSSRRSTFLASWIATWAIFRTKKIPLLSPSTQLASKVRFLQGVPCASVVLSFPIPPNNSRNPMKNMVDASWDKGIFVSV